MSKFFKCFPQFNMNLATFRTQPQLISLRGRNDHWSCQDGTIDMACLEGFQFMLKATYN